MLVIQIPAAEKITDQYNAEFLKMYLANELGKLKLALFTYYAGYRWWDYLGVSWIQHAGIFSLSSNSKLNCEIPMRSITNNGTAYVKSFQSIDSTEVKDFKKLLENREHMIASIITAKESFAYLMGVIDHAIEDQLSLDVIIRTGLKI